MDWWNRQTFQIRFNPSCWADYTWVHQYKTACGHAYICTTPYVQQHVRIKRNRKKKFSLHSRSWNKSRHNLLCPPTTAFNLRLQTRAPFERNLSRQRHSLSIWNNFILKKTRSCLFGNHSQESSSNIAEDYHWLEHASWSGRSGILLGFSFPRETTSWCCHSTWFRHQCIAIQTIEWSNKGTAKTIFYFFEKQSADRAIISLNGRYYLTIYPHWFSITQVRCLFSTFFRFIDAIFRHSG